MHRTSVMNLDIGLAIDTQGATAQLRQADTGSVPWAACVHLAPQPGAIGKQRHRVTHLQANHRRRFSVVTGRRGQRRRDFVDDDAVGVLLTCREGFGAGQANQLLLPRRECGHRRAANHITLILILIVKTVLIPGKYPNLHAGRRIPAVFQPQRTGLLVSFQYRVDRPYQNRTGRQRLLSHPQHQQAAGQALKRP